MNHPRITINPTVMGGRPCIRGLRITVSAVLKLLNSGYPRDRVLNCYPEQEPDDLEAVLAYGSSDDGPAPFTLRALPIK
jgi:uncharacterized protein (DUF433 family)